MPLGTLDRSAPTLFKHGPSPLSRLALYSALALFLMVADARFHVTEPLRKAVGTVLYPLQWLMLQPVELAEKGGAYLQSLQAAQQGADEAQKRMAKMSVRAGGADQLLRDLDRLLAEETGLPVLVAEEPLTCVVRGCGIALERMDRQGSIFTSD